MIFLRILSKDKQQIEQIAALLLREKLAIDVTMKHQFDRMELNNDELVSSDIYLLTAKTKGLLFPSIDQKLQNLFHGNMPEVYSLPIVHMDWEQAELLTSEVKSI